MAVAINMALLRSFELAARERGGLEERFSRKDAKPPRFKRKKRHAKGGSDGRHLSSGTGAPVFIQAQRGLAANGTSSSILPATRFGFFAPPLAPEEGMIPVIDTHYNHNKEGRNHGDHHANHGDPTMCISQEHEDASENDQATEIQEWLNLVASEPGLG